MNGNVLDYKGCCSKLEKIASKRKMYGSESNVRLDNKDSKPVISTENVLLNEVKSKNKIIPFICVGSANKSHHIGINLQMTLSLIKRFPGSDFHGREYAECNWSGPQTNVNGAGSWQQLSGVHACPAGREDAAENENETYDGTELDPWTVRQTDVAVVSQNYYNVMTPFVENAEGNLDGRPSGTVQNPYAKEKLVKYYELMSKHLLSLKSAMITMNNEFMQLSEKYNRFYRQHVRNKDNNLTVTLLRTEDELNVLKSKIEETVDEYKETVFAVAQQWRLAAATAGAADADRNVGPYPRETTAVRLSRVLRRVQCLQEKLESARIVHGASGDQTAVAVRR